MSPGSNIPVASLAASEPAIESVRFSWRVPVLWFLGSVLVGTPVLTAILVLAADGLEIALLVIAFAASLFVGLFLFPIVAVLERRAVRRLRRDEEGRLVRTETGWRMVRGDLRPDAPQSLRLSRRRRNVLEAGWLAADSVVFVVALAWVFSDQIGSLIESPRLRTLLLVVVAGYLAIRAYRGSRRPESDVRILVDRRAVFWPEDEGYRRVPREEVEDVRWVRGGESPCIVLRAGDLALTLPDRSLPDEEAARRAVSWLRAELAEDGARETAAASDATVSLPFRVSSLAFWCLFPIVAVAYGAQVRLGGGEDPIVLLVLGALSPALVEAGDAWRIVHSSLLHLGPVHFGVNMLALHWLSKRVSPILGVAGSILTFCVSAIAGAGFSVWLGGDALYVGASGGVLGLLGAETALYGAAYGSLVGGPRPRAHFLSRLFWVLVISLLPGVAFLGHLGGFFAGAVVARLVWIRRGERGRSPGAPRPLLTALALLAVAPFFGATGWMAYRALDGELDLRDPGLYDLRVPMLTNHVAWSLAWDPETTREELERSLSAMERALGEERDPGMVDTLAALELRSGDYARALELQREAALGEPSRDLVGRARAYAAVDAWASRTGVEAPPAVVSARLQWRDHQGLDLDWRHGGIPAEVVPGGGSSDRMSGSTWVAFVADGAERARYAPALVVQCRGPSGSIASPTVVSWQVVPGRWRGLEEGLELRLGRVPTDVLDPTVETPSQLLAEPVGFGTCGLWALPSPAGIVELD